MDLSKDVFSNDFSNDDFYGEEFAQADFDSEDLLNPDFWGQDLLKGLNKEQKEAVLHDKGPLLILAGAGSGKTRVITHRIAYLVEARSVAPRNILAITFTNKAAREMKTRVEKLLGDNTCRGMWIGTFHSMMARVLRRFAEHLGFTNNFAIADSTDQKSMITSCIKDLNLDDKTFDSRTVMTTISKAKNKLLSPEAYAKLNNGQFWQEQVARVYSLYQERLKANNLMDFDDLLYYPVKLFKEHKDVLEIYQDRFQYIMVDEYQDTNGAQYEIVKLLSSKHKNLCVVGDDDQSIYSFRGANVQNILDFEKDFKDCKVIKLEQNYRSTANILDSANAVIGNNTGRKSKKLWTSTNAGEKVVRIFAPNERAEAMFIAEEIKRKVAGGDGSYKDIAILYRINALSRNLEFSFNQMGIPFKIYGGLRFFDRKEIKDVMSYLRLLTSPRDDMAFVRAISNPKRGVGDTSLDRIAALANQYGVSMMEIALKIDEFPELSRATNNVKAFIQLIAKMQHRLLNEDWSLAEFIEYVENESGLIEDILAKKDKNREEAYNRIENMKELLSEAVNFKNLSDEGMQWDFTDEELAGLEGYDPNSGDPFAATNNSAETAAVKEDTTNHSALEETLLESLIRFLEQSSLYTDMDSDAEEDDKKVTLMTIHSAKGLEFDTVFVVGMEEGIFPGYRSMAEAASLEEERRLAYVAITRAERKLYLSASNSRLIFGRTESYAPSRFLSELPDENITDLGYSQAMQEERYSSYRDTSDFNRVNSAIGERHNTSGGYESRSKFSMYGKEEGFVGSKKDADKQNNIQLEVKKAGNLQANDIKKGMKVKHAKFGVGEVLAVEPVAGDAILSIDFGAKGEKKLLANSANLAKV